MLEKYYSETAWSAFYAERVNNIGYINAFGNKYKKLINFIDACLNMYTDLIIKENASSDRVFFSFFYQTNHENN